MKSCQTESLNRLGNYARRPPVRTLATSPCGINGDVSRDTPALAFGVNYSVFKEPLSDNTARPTSSPVWKVRKRRTDTHLSPRSATPSWSEDFGAGPARGVRVNASGAQAPGADQGLYGAIAEAATRSADFSHRPG
jgi:hypothetical protein